MSSTGAGHVMRRIPRIKFPQRHPKPQGSSSAAEQKVEISRLGFTSQAGACQSSPKPYRFRSEVPAPPTNTGVGGKASMLPKRTAVSEKEIEAILLIQVLQMHGPIFPTLQVTDF